MWIASLSYYLTVMLITIFRCVLLRAAWDLALPQIWLNLRLLILLGWVYEGFKNHVSAQANKEVFVECHHVY
jgi:hypothetical protein